MSQEFGAAPAREGATLGDSKELAPLGNTAVAANIADQDAIQGADLDSPEDILWGAARIGAPINRSEQQVYHMHAVGKLRGAVRSFDGVLVGSKRALLRVVLGISSTTIVVVVVFVLTHEIPWLT